MIAALLFDLDGTLADTAPDLADALNRLRQERGLDALPESSLRRWTSNGTRGMLHAGLDMPSDHPDYAGTARRYLELYATAPFVRTRLFPGLDLALDAIEAEGWRWGVVTNKPRALAAPVMDGLGLSRRMCCLVGGTCAPAAKPSPAPLLLACDQASLSPSACVYVGDDRRDIEAGRAAGMRTIAAAWGYLGDDDDVASWQADAIAEHPGQLMAAVAKLPDT